MKITKLKLNNFSSFEGENIFDFSNDNDHPIILIGGQNGAGKTSLFTAIKVALYGPLAFGYTGMNSFYIKKIKTLINAKVFQEESFSAGVTIDIILKQDRDINKYKISRMWSINNQKLDEDYIVEMNDKKLSESDKTLFESYLMTVIPPDLFDFFLFDGEEVGNIFSNDNYNKYVKNALLTMCGIDVFSVIQKFCKGFVSNSSSDELSDIEENYNKHLGLIEEANNLLEEKKKRIEYIKERTEELKVTIQQVNNEFLRAGGIPEKTKEKLQKKSEELEKKRVEYAQQIKNFVEEDMPAYILKDFNSKVNKQINLEEKKNIVDYVKYMVTEDYLKSVLKEENINSYTLAENLYSAILTRLGYNPNTSNEEENYIFSLSRDEISQIDFITTKIDELNIQEIIDKILEKEKISQEAFEINSRIRNSLSDEDEKKYKDKLESAQKEMSDLNIEYEKDLETIEQITIKLDNYNKDKEILHKKLIDQAQNKHAYKLSEDVSKMMEELIEIKLKNIRQQLSEKTITNLHEIYRKQNLISQIEIESDFHFKLYQKQNYTISELQALLSNLGNNEFSEIIGNSSIQLLCKELNCNSDELTKQIKSMENTDKTFELYKKIELNRLSKGERQIFILALYWAIIQISGRKIPFIIDTPYARIDAKHREEISKKFFPNISEQVIILSTDEEISENYYKILKPNISKKYLLINNKNENRTHIENRYFFEV